jgi:hypothetical protein
VNRMHRHAAIAAHFLRLVLHADPSPARRTFRIHTLHSLAHRMLHHPSAEAELLFRKFWVLRCDALTAL